MKFMKYSYSKVFSPPLFIDKKLKHFLVISYLAGNFPFCFIRISLCSEWLTAMSAALESAGVSTLSTTNLVIAAPSSSGGGSLAASIWWLPLIPAVWLSIVV